MKRKLTYKRAGVDYSIIDPLKILAQKQALKTVKTFKKHFLIPKEKTRGESAYVMEYKDCYFAAVTECLGTKNLIADQVQKITGKSYYDSIAQDTVAMIVNDLITVGAFPQVIFAYWAIGNSDWLKNKERLYDLVSGWTKACKKSEAVWGGGETSTLSGIVEKDTADLAGSAFGIIKPKRNLILVVVFMPMVFRLPGKLPINYLVDIKQNSPAEKYMENHY